MLCVVYGRRSCRGGESRGRRGGVGRRVVESGGEGRSKSTSYNKKKEKGPESTSDAPADLIRPNNSLRAGSPLFGCAERRAVGLHVKL